MAAGFWIQGIGSDKILNLGLDTIFLESGQSNIITFDLALDLSNLLQYNQLRFKIYTESLTPWPCLN